ncbi:MAG: hypothetical protein IT330_13815 [Anaerolineae bacterium]|nr:hypothetical protein [Anaerolineae bacterium]
MPEGRDKPYALDGSHIYVRAETETSLAMRDEIVRLVRQNLLREEPPTTGPGVMPEAAMPQPPVTAPVPVVEPARGETPPAAPSAVVAVPLIPPPRVGVEILGAVERKGTMYYTVKDLRNGAVVHNVTKGSARKLWSYAIQQWEQNDLDAERVRWIGAIGLWQASRRAGKMRYDFVQRGPEGKLHIYYGVTEEGIEGEWRHFLQEGGEPEIPEVMQAVLSAAAKEPPVTALTTPVISSVASETPPMPLPAATEPQSAKSEPPSGEQRTRRGGGGRRRKVTPLPEAFTAEPRAEEIAASASYQAAPEVPVESAGGAEGKPGKSTRSRRSRRASGLSREAAEAVTPPQLIGATSDTEVTEARTRRRAPRRRPAKQGDEQRSSGTDVGSSA